MIRGARRRRTHCICPWCKQNTEIVVGARLSNLNLHTLSIVSSQPVTPGRPLRAPATVSYTNRALPYSKHTSSTCELHQGWNAVSHARSYGKTESLIPLREYCAARDCTIVMQREDKLCSDCQKPSVDSAELGAGQCLQEGHVPWIELQKLRPAAGLLCRPACSVGHCTAWSQRQ